eukprot:9182-Heterococcus_DN1.PRE.2
MPYTAFLRKVCGNEVLRALLAPVVNIIMTTALRTSRIGLWKTQTRLAKWRIRCDSPQYKFFFAMLLCKSSTLQPCITFAKALLSSTVQPSTSSGRRRMQGPKLSLRDFMRRSQVLHTYRQLLKVCSSAADYELRNLHSEPCARRMDDKQQGQEVAAQIKAQYRTFQHETDSLKLRMLMADAAQHVDALQGAVHRKLPAGVGSWMDTQDEEDRRGRVGLDFPWQR